MNTSIKNSVSLIGNLGANPVTTTFDENRKMTRFSIATTESYRDAKGANQTKTYWHNIVTWGKTAEIAEAILGKGQKIALSGKLVNRSFDSKEGDKKYITEIHASDLLLLGKKAVEKNSQAF